MSVQFITALAGALTFHVEVHYTNGQIVTGLVVENGFLPPSTVISISPRRPGDPSRHRVDYSRISKVLVYPHGGGDPATYEL